MANVYHRWKRVRTSVVPSRSLSNKYRCENKKFPLSSGCLLKIPPGWLWHSITNQVWYAIKTRKVNEMPGKKTRWERYKDAARWINNGSSSLWKNNCAATYISSHKLSTEDEQEMLDTTGEKRTNSSDVLQCTVQYWLTNRNLHSSVLCGH